MKKILVTGVALAMVSTTVLAADDEQKQVITQDEMVVTGSRVEERLIDVPINTQVIGQDQIEMSGATDLGELLAKYVTGHSNKYNSGLLNPVGLRGFQTDAHGLDLEGKVLLLVDGHRIGTGNAAKINLERIERVEVIKGTSSALYGSAAMGGVINLITKKGDGQLGGSIGGEFGSFEYFKSQANVGGEVSDKIRFFASVSGETVDDFETVNYGTAYNSGTDKFNIGGNFVYTINDDHEIRIGGNYSDLTGDSPQWDSIQYSHYDDKNSQYSDKSTGYADMEYNGDYLHDQLHWKAVLYYLWDKNHWFTGTADPESYQTKYIDQTFGTDQQLTWKINKINTLMFGMTLDSLEKEGHGLEAYLPTAAYTPDLEYLTQGYFLQDSLDLLDNRLNVIAAVRYDRFDIETSQSESGSSTDFIARDTYFSHVSPKIGVGMKFLNERLRLRGDIGEGYKAPGAGELGYDTWYGSYHYLGNPNLDPETSMTYDLGVDVYLKSITFSTDYFHTNYEDKITYTYTPDGPSTIVSFENTDSATISGFEFSVDWAFGKALDLPFSASIWNNLSLNVDKEDDATGDDLTNISDYEIKSGLKVGYDGLEGQLTHTLVGPQMRTATQEMASFQFWDLTLRYQFLKQWEVKASIFNLFDEDYSFVYGYPMPERSYRLGLTYKF